MEPEQTDFLSYKRARFTANLPRACVYSPDHFWIGQQADDTWRVGLTKFGSRLLGEMVDYGFDLVAGAAVKTGQTLGWVEGFKALSEMHCVAEGIFLGPNPALEQQITLINQDPFGAGWLYAVKGVPDPACVDVNGYANLLDQTIDDWLRKR